MLVLLLVLTLSNHESGQIYLREHNVLEGRRLRALTLGRERGTQGDWPDCCQALGMSARRLWAVGWGHTAQRGDGAVGGSKGGTRARGRRGRGRGRLNVRMARPNVKLIVVKTLIVVSVLTLTITTIRVR